MEVWKLQCNNDYVCMLMPQANTSLCIFMVTWYLIELLTYFPEMNKLILSIYNFSYQVYNLRSPPLPLGLSFLFQTNPKIGTLT